ncbi:MAG: ABC transporter ATP-binding protein [Panacagrimonas sp.]
MPETPALRIQALCHDYGAAPVLVLDALSLAPSEQMLVMGPSGSGKSTLLHAIAGLLRPSQGEIHIAGQALTALSSRQLDRFRGQHIGIVFQRLHLLPALTVLQNLLWAQGLAGRSRDPAAAMQLLEKLGVQHLAGRMPAQLSQGQAQRVAVTRALLSQPRLLLADEPTSSLDDVHAERTLTLLRTQAAEIGAALLVVSHDRRLRGQFDQQLELEARE